MLPESCLEERGEGAEGLRGRKEHREEEKERNDLGEFFWLLSRLQADARKISESLLAGSPLPTLGESHSHFWNITRSQLQSSQ